MAIGICDWGIGGVGLYQHLRKRSRVDVVYFSDTGYTPYGKVPEEELKQRLKKVFAYFNGLGITQIIVGCNAASTVLNNEEGVIGIIEHGVKLVLEQQITRVGIVGGKRTVESEIYKKQLEEKGVEVHQRIAQPLSARIEAGEVSSPGLTKDIEEIFTPIRDIQHILLACTHYPLIKNEIARFTGNTIFLDPAEEMVDWIFKHWEIEEGQGNVRWQTSGDTNQMKNSLATLYQIQTNQIEKIEP
jgi:glutamate racemase